MMTPLPAPSLSWVWKRLFTSQPLCPYLCQSVLFFALVALVPLCYKAASSSYYGRSCTFLLQCLFMFLITVPSISTILPNLCLRLCAEFLTHLIHYICFPVVFLFTAAFIYVFSALLSLFPQVFQFWAFFLFSPFFNSWHLQQQCNKASDGVV